MPVTLPRNLLVKSLTKIAVATTYKPTDPIDACAEISAENGRLRFRVARTSGHVLLDIPNDGELPTTWVNVRNLLDCARSVTGDVTLSAGTNKITIEADGARFDLATETPATPRPMPAPLDGDALVVAGDALATLLARVSPYVAPGDNRYWLNGMSWEFADGKLLGVATDGNRLGRATVPASGALTLPKGAIVGADALAVLAAFAPVGDVRVTFGAVMGTRVNRATGQTEPVATSGWMRAEWDGGILHTRLTLADFPDWRQVIPATYPRTITVDRDALMVAVRRGGKLARGSSRSLYVDVTAGRVTLTSRAPDIGTAQASVPAGVVGEPIRFGLNRDFVLATLRTLPAGPVEVRPTTNLGPCSIRSMVDMGVEAIVMPVRLD